MENIEANRRWSTIKLITFRFSSVFIVAFILLKHNNAFSVLTAPLSFLNSLLKKVTPWFAENIIHYKYDYTIFTNGSGDTTFDWISLLIIFLLALSGTIIWSLIDRKKQNYYHAYYWLTVLIRYYIAFMLINYGAIKLIHSQMPPPTLNRLITPLGEFSPMGLAWTFLGYSKGYNIFMGVVEIMAGFLLSRRTIVLGAFITLATSVNIMTVNYFFDVPVKMISTALCLLSLFLLLPYARPLYSLLFKRVPTQLPVFEHVARKRVVRRIKHVIKFVIIAQFTISLITSLFSTKEYIATYYKRSELYGIYEIRQEQSKAVAIPKDWSLIVFEFKNMASIRDKRYMPIFTPCSIDTAESTISINNYTLDYKKQYNGDIILRKRIKNETQEIRLVKINHDEFELVKRKFNWVQEYPYNR